MPMIATDFGCIIRCSTGSRALLGSPAGIGSLLFMRSRAGAPHTLASNGAAKQEAHCWRPARSLNGTILSTRRARRGGSPLGPFLGRRGEPGPAHLASPPDWASKGSFWRVSMSKALRVAHGVFGRVALLDMDRQLVRHAHPHCHVLLKIEGADTQFAVRDAIAPLTDGNAVLIN